MRIAHLTTVDSSLRYLLLPQLMEIVARGGTSIGISAPGPDVPFLLALGIEHRPLSASTRSASLGADLRTAWQLWRLLRREPIDVLHTHNPKPGVYGRILGRLAGVPLVVNTVHGFYATETDGFLKRAAVYLMEAAAALFSDIELVQSKEDVVVMRRFHIGRRSRTVHLGNGIDLERFRPDPEDDVRQRVRVELGILSDAVVVGFVGRLVAEKGIPELLRAWQLRETDFELLILGPPDPTKSDALSQSMIDEAEEAGVRFLGHRDHIEEFYRALDVFVLPSHREGFPRAAMEAAASGLAIVATDIRGCREVVDHRLNGLLVPTGDPVRLAAAIDQLVMDPVTRTSMGEQGRKKARAEFDERVVVDRVIGAYRDAASRKGLMELNHALASSTDETNARD